MLLHKDQTNYFLDAPWLTSADCHWTATELLLNWSTHCSIHAAPYIVHTIHSTYCTIHAALNSAKDALFYIPTYGAGWNKAQFMKYLILSFNFRYTHTVLNYSTINHL